MGARQWDRQPKAAAWGRGSGIGSHCRLDDGNWGTMPQRMGCCKDAFVCRGMYVVIQLMRDDIAAGLGCGANSLLMPPLSVAVTFYPYDYGSVCNWSKRRQPPHDRATGHATVLPNRHVASWMPDLFNWKHSSHRFQFLGHCSIIMINRF